MMIRLEQVGRGLIQQLDSVQPLVMLWLLLTIPLCLLGWVFHARFPALEPEVRSAVWERRLVWWGWLASFVLLVMYLAG